ncbi:SDR family oxidoreductase [Rhizobium sp. No.120]
MPLKGKRILITGAGSGIGRALAIDASRRGARICICGRREDKLHETMESLLGAGHMELAADITVDVDRSRLLQLLVRKWDGLDILVNNAGLITSGALEQTSAAHIEALVTTNVLAPMLLTRQLIPLLEIGAIPRVVNIGSMFGEIPFPDFAAYSASKAAIKGFSIALRRELSGTGIAVTYAAPRATDTDGAAMALEKAGNRKLDSPDRVAAQIWDAVHLGKKHVYPSGLERLFMLLQSIAPGFVDRAVAGKPTQTPATQGQQIQKETTHVQH